MRLLPITAAALALIVAIGLVVTLDGGGVPAQPATRFVDATERAGLDFLQHEVSPRGECLFDDVQIPETGTFCDAERMTGGAAAGDFDGDGYVDLVITRLDDHDLLLRNRGDGTFEDATRAWGLDDFREATNGAVWGDIDNDGDLDLFITTVGGLRHWLFVNEGRRGFVEAAVERGAALDTGDRRIGFSASFGDYDGDGWIDLHVTEWRPSQLVGEASTGVRLLRNRGAAAPGHFEDVTMQAGVNMVGVVSQTQDTLTDGTFAFASGFVDLDGDGLLDLTVASDFGTTRLFWNDGDGTFTDGTVAAWVGTAQNAMGLTFGDYDLDGDFDWFVTSVYQRSSGSPGTDGPGPRDGNRLYRNEGDRRFSDRTDTAGVRNGGWGWGAAFFDAENDGDLDLVMTNGMEMMPGHDADSTRYWENDGAGAFRGRSTDAGLDDQEDGKGLLVLDLENDGDLDVLVLNNGARPLLYRNDSVAAGNWLRVSAEGVQSNRGGLGARVTVYAPGMPPQVRQVGAATHFLGQSDERLHFGLGAAERVSLEIHWPASGLRTRYENIPANTWLLIREGSPTPTVLTP